MELLPPERYQTEMAHRFSVVAERLAALTQDADIEHVGSSAIPGAISKADLDICLVVAADKLESTVLILKSDGYVEQTDTLRTPELCMLVDPRPDTAHAVQVVAKGSQFMFFVEFRDRLKADPRLVEQYNRVKREAARLDEDAYRVAKSRFIESVLAIPAEPGFRAS